MGAQSKQMAASRGYSVLDQHYDQNAMLAHHSTAQELLVQLPHVTDVVCATGTGATAAGLRAALPDHIAVHSRWSESGKIDGLGDVRRYGNYCDPESLQGLVQGAPFQNTDALEYQQLLRQQHHIQAGASTGAVMWLAQQVRSTKPDA